MSSMIWRIIIALIVVVALFAVVPRLFAIMQMPLSGDVWFVLRVCIGGLGLLYILKGKP